MQILRSTRIGGLVAVDILAVNLSICAASVLGQATNGLTTMEIVLACLLYVATLHVFKAYTSLWEKAGIDELLQLASATFFASILIRLLMFVKYDWFEVSEFIVGSMTTFMVSAGARFAYRALRHLKNRTFPRLSSIRENKLKKVLIIGAGDTARMLLKDMAEGNTTEYKPMAIIDDNPLKWGLYLNNVKIIGGRDRIEWAVKRYGIDMIIVAVPSASQKQQGEILRICNRTGRKIRIFPGIIDMLSGKVNVGKMRDVRLEDLLGRDPVELDEKGIAGIIEGQTVLITGGAGSIGSELARQCLRFNPARVVVLDMAENKMYMLAQEVKRMNLDADFVTLVGSVRDEGRVDAVFNLYRPDIVFHAAAHKHVPLMEDSSSEAVKNNVCGTYIVTKAAMKYGSKRFVLISTDKAVKPTSVMGASKRFCELLIGSLEPTGTTRFASVRFGNVLGSDGSVVPIFTEQIKAGGPVTVTHPEITRYFMLISEAVQLVLQAASMMEGNELFVLDMGTPVRIDDMAKDLIRLHDLEPGQDIKVEYTGLRKGEKMYEELFYDPVSVCGTSHSKVFASKKRFLVSNEVAVRELDRLSLLAEEGKDADIREELMRFVNGGWMDDESLEAREKLIIPTNGVSEGAAISFKDE